MSGIFFFSYLVQVIRSNVSRKFMFDYKVNVNLRLTQENRRKVTCDRL